MEEVNNKCFSFFTFCLEKDGKDVTQKKHFRSMFFFFLYVQYVRTIKTIVT